jgi:hypothetical protein
MSIQIGFHTDSSIATTKTDLGLTTGIVRVFPAGMPWSVTLTPDQVVAKLTAAIQPVLDAGLIPFWEVKFDPVQMVAGKFDAHLDAIKNAMPSGSYCTYWHEPEHSSMTPAQFVAAYEYFDQKINELTKFYCGPVLQGYAWRAATGEPQWVPREVTRDFIGIDVYTSDWSGNTRSLRDMPEFTNILAAAGIDPIMLVERGISTGQGLAPPADPAQQAAVIRADLAYLESLPNRVRGYLYWDSSGATDGTSDYHLNATSADLLRAYSAPVVPPVIGPPPTLPRTGVSLEVCNVCSSLVFDVDVHYAAMHP